MPHFEDTLEMECVLLWLDDLDDLFSMLAHQAERLKPAFTGLLLLLATVAVTAAGTYFAFTQPPVALALVCLLTVTALYRASVTGRTDLVRG